MSKIVEAFKNIFNISNVNRLRGNKFKVFKERCKLNVRKYFFNLRIVGVWNSLPNKVVCSNTLIKFKNSVERTA